MRRHIPLLLIVVVYFIIGALYIQLTPAWQTPDEPAHYNYVRQLAAGQLPLMEVGDYDQDYLVEVVFESGFAPGYSVEAITYEDWQPPLYYVVQTPLFLAAEGSLESMRMLSLLMGAGVIALAYAIVLRIAAAEHWLALTAAAFVAFLPQHLAIMASVNNDSLAELLIATILYLLIDISLAEENVSSARFLLLGFVLGLGFLTKGTVYPTTLVVALVLVWNYWRDWAALVRAGLLVYGPAILLGSLWWIRNLAVYGGLDVMGKQRHDSVVVGQPRTTEWIAEFGLSGTIGRFVETSFNSFWGQFGWMTVPMTHPSWLYPLLWVFSGVALVGLISSAFVERKKLKQNVAVVLPFVALFGLTFAVFAGYNLQFVQHQGRYLFPALIPIALGVAVGLGLWSKPFRQRRPWLVYAIPLGLSAVLIALDVYALYYVIVPALA